MKIEDFLIEENASVIKAMEKLDTTGQRILFIAPEGKLKAALTDGDLRKFILKGGCLDNNVQEAANYKPFSLKIEERGLAKKEMESRAIDAIPLLDKNGCLVDVVFANDFDVMRVKTVNKPVVIMAGGLGARLYPYTKILPKPLIPIGEIPVVEHIINKFHDFGCTEFNLIVNYKKSMIKSYFAETEKDYTINFTDEDKPLGTGGGLALLKGSIRETFFLSNCDILINADYADLYEMHKKNGNKITIVCAVQKTVVPYGVIELDNNGEITDFVEKPEISHLINTGLYVIEPEIIDSIEPNVAITMPEIIENHHKAGEKVGIYPISENSWMDMGQLEELEKMRTAFENV